MTLQTANEPTDSLFVPEYIGFDKFPGLQIIPLGHQAGEFAAVHFVQPLPYLVGQTAVGLERTAYIPAGR